MEMGAIDRRDATEVDDTQDAVIDGALASVREHLGMPIAYLSEFVGERTVFRNVSAPGLADLIKPGDSRSLDEVYCRHILAGDLPQLIPDTAAEPLARSLPITEAAPIGSHVSLPIERADGSVYGMFCCLSPQANPTLNERDLKVMRMFASLAAEQVRLRLRDRDGRRAARDEVTRLLDAGRFGIVYQPIYRFSDGALSSFEALCRFEGDPYRPPDVVFGLAKAADLQSELEIAAIERALLGLPDLRDGLRLAVNASPNTVASGALRRLVARRGAERITVEITEHDAVADYDRLNVAVAELRGLGALIAIDDVGAGYSGLQQILGLRPDLLKLDMSLVRDIHSDPARRAMAAALIHFAGETGGRVTAEGLEVRDEWDALHRLGAHYGQGWLLGRPGRIGDAAAWMSGART